MNDSSLAATAAAPAASTWIIVTQVKSNRVVYFTDDPLYQPPMDGDWYYCSPHAGALPQDMTLRNCWRWRYNGGVFTDAQPRPQKSAQQVLIDNNRKALLAILHEKIDTIRAPYLPACKYGDEVRRLKLQQAQAYLACAGNPDDEARKAATYPQLQAVAIARNSSLLEAAQLILAKAEETRRVLLDTEAFREQLSMAIHNASSAPALLDVRNWLLDQVYPALSAEFRYRIDNTEPIDLERPLADVHREHEIARLKAQLREAINAERAPLRSDYLGNEEIRKHKARLAHGVLAHGGVAPPGLDCSLLEAYAQARQIDLATAAQTIVEAMAASAALLQRTEATKDRLLARIDGIRTLADIRAIGEAIAALGNAA